MRRQDLGVPEPPRVRLGVLLALLRILAGVRGHAALRWSGGGFVYVLSVARSSPLPYGVDADPDALGGDDARARLGELFGP